jgi:predicted ATPase
MSFVFVFVFVFMFEGIWAGGGTLVATSNRPPESLYEKGLNRDQFVPFIHQLQSKCEVHQLRSTAGQDYRLRHVSASATELTGGSSPHASTSPYFHVLGTAEADAEEGRRRFVAMFQKEAAAAGGDMATTTLHQGNVLRISHGRCLTVPYCNVDPRDMHDASSSKRGIAMVLYFVVYMLIFPYYK